MAQEINLKEIERKAWRSFYQDGLCDIFLSLLLLAMAFGAWLSDIGMSEVRSMLIYSGLLSLALLVLWAGKRRITVPRMGRVRFGPKRKRRLSKVRVVLAISVLVGAALFVAGLVLTGKLSRSMIFEFILPAGWVVNMSIVFGLLAYFVEFSRLYVIGAMYAIALPLDIVIHRLVGLDLTFAAFDVPAAVILLMGAVVFVRFLRDYPLLAEEAPGVNC